MCLVAAVMQYGGVAQVGERVTMKLRADVFEAEAVLRREEAYFDREGFTGRRKPWLQACPLTASRDR